MTVKPVLSRSYTFLTGLMDELAAEADKCGDKRGADALRYAFEEAERRISESKR